MVALPPESEGKRVRLTVPVAIRPPAVEYRDACSVGRAFVTLEHPDDQGGTYTVSGKLTGGLWFRTASGQLLDGDGLAMAPRSCSATVIPEPTPSVDLSVRPSMTVDDAYWVAVAELEAVVPDGAVKVGGWLRVPGCVSPAVCRPSSGVWAFEIETSASPGAVPLYGGDDAAWPSVAGLPVASDATRPTSCGDRDWYRRTREDVWVDPSATEAFRADQEACLQDFVKNAWVP